MNNDPAAWKLMEKYNQQDVNITDRVYEKLLGWITTHPDISSYEGLEGGCKNCGSEHFQPALIRTLAMARP